MSRSAIWAVNATLVVACCFLIAMILTEIAADVLVPTQASAAVLPSSALAPARGWQDRQVIVRRDLFDVGSLAPKSPVKQPDEDEVYEKTRLPIKLLGTAVGDEKTSLAALQDLESRENLVARVGDKLKDRAEVIRIERRRIVLRNGGKLEELALEDDKKPGSRRGATVGRNSRRPRAARGKTRARERVEKLANNRFSVARTDVENATRNPAQLFSQARILPKYEDGKMMGVQLNSIKAGSIFEEIGIQNGDVIKQLNGIEITSQQDSAKVLRELTQAQQISVTACASNGVCRDLYYEIK